MKEEVSGCGRENDLVSFLYGELDADESRAFERHLVDCRVCSAELPAFGAIRTSVMAWRDQSLAGMVAPVTANVQPLSSAIERKPSAVAALREFFNLSPLWMKGAVVFASLLFCMVTILAVAHWFERPPATVTGNPELKYTDAQVKEIVRQEVERSKNVQPGNSDQVVTALPQPSSGEEYTPRRPANNHKGSIARRPLSKTEREQLALDLRLASPHEPEIDLLGDKINQ